MDNQCVKNELIEIFRKLFELDFEKDCSTYKEAHLLSSKLKLAPRDLIYLLVTVEEVFNICLPQEQIACGEFSSFNRICSMINKQLELE